MDDLPAPFSSSDCDCTNLDGFMLNVERLMASELVAIESHETIAAAIFLWCRAWKQKPAASLPDDDRIIAAFARLPIQKFKKVRDGVMHGFVKCSDGRFYHRVLAAEAMAAFSRKKAFLSKREADAERLRKWRSSHSETGDDTHVETHSETRFVADGNGKDRDRDRDREGTGTKKEEEGKKEEKRKRLFAQFEADFDLFWEPWPNKVGRPAAEKAFAKVARELAQIVTGVERYVRDKPPNREWLNPSTFLNQRRWEDQPASVVAFSPRADSPKPRTNLRVEAILESQRDDQNGLTVHIPGI